MLFGALIYFLLIVVFGYSLSTNIENNVEYMIFWMLYIATIFTITILIGSFFMSLSLKDLSGMPGERGIMGENGKIGKAGFCDIDCRDDIGYDIIINAIKNRLIEEESMKRGKFIDENQRKINDHIRFYNNMNLSMDEIKVKLTTKYNTKENEDTKKKYNELIKDSEYIENVINGNYIDTDIDFEINNTYIKEKIKTILNSTNFRDMVSYRGPMKLIEYIKDLWLIWIKLIYDASNINYFTSVGAENDFEWTKDNPFNEIKKYDVFSWGLSNKSRPRCVNVQEKYEKNIEFVKEGFNEVNKNISIKQNRTLKKQAIKDDMRKKMEAFEDYTKIKKPKVKGIAHPDNKARLKIMRTNDYYFTYDDTGTTMKEQIRSYRPYSKKHNGDIYRPLGDIIIGPSKDNANDGSKLIFSDKYDDESRTFEKKGKIEGPNRDTILVAGDIKEPERYETIWHDLQKKMTRHWTCKLCKKNPRHSYYRGIAHRPICPKGYTSLGDVYTSQDNQSPMLKKSTDQFGTYEPITGYHPVCIPSNCVEVIKDKNPQIIWDTYRSQRPAFGSGSSNWYKYVVDNAQIFSFTPNIGKQEFVKGTHENSYNLSRLWLEKNNVRGKTDSERAVKDSYKEDEYYQRLNQGEQDLEIQEDFAAALALLANPLFLAAGAAIITLVKGLEKPLMFRPYMYRIKEECIIKNNDVNLGGDDYKWPSILKDDKTGEPNEDKTVFFIPEDEEVKLVEYIPIPKIITDNPSQKKIIIELRKLQNYFQQKEKINKLFSKDSQYKQYYINIFTNLNDNIISYLNPNTYEYQEEDYPLFYFLTEYIGLLSSLPSLLEYDELKTEKNEIYNLYTEIMQPINEKKINNLKLKLGLGWKGIPRFDQEDEDYSMHHFFYIDNIGNCYSKNKDNQLTNISLYFNKIKSPDIYSIKTLINMKFKYIGLNYIDNTNIYNTKYKYNVPSEEDIDFHFKLRMTGNNTDEIIIKHGNEKYKDYLLIYNTDDEIFKFMKEKDIKKIHNKTYQINYNNE